MLFYYTWQRFVAIHMHLAVPLKRDTIPQALKDGYLKIGPDVTQDVMTNPIVAKVYSIIYNIMRRTSACGNHTTYVIDLFGNQTGLKAAQEMRTYGNSGNKTITAITSYTQCPEDVQAKHKSTYKLCLDAISRMFLDILGPKLQEWHTRDPSHILPFPDGLKTANLQQKINRGFVKQVNSSHGGKPTYNNEVGNKIYNWIFTSDGPDNAPVVIPQLLNDLQLAATALKRGDFNFNKVIEEQYKSKKQDDPKPNAPEPTNSKSDAPNALKEDDASSEVISVDNNITPTDATLAVLYDQYSQLNTKVTNMSEKTTNAFASIKVDSVIMAKHSDVKQSAEETRKYVKDVIGDLSRNLSDQVVNIVQKDLKHHLTFVVEENTKVQNHLSSLDQKLSDIKTALNRLFAQAADNDYAACEQFLQNAKEPSLDSEPKDTEDVSKPGDDSKETVDPVAGSVVDKQVLDALTEEELAEGLQAVAPAHKAADNNPPKTPSPSPSLRYMFTASTAKKYEDSRKDPMYLPPN